MKNFAMPCACYTSLNGATGLPKFLTISGFALAPLKYQRLRKGEGGLLWEADCGKKNAGFLT